MFYPGSEAVSAFPFKIGGFRTSIYFFSGGPVNKFVFDYFPRFNDSRGPSGCSSHNPEPALHAVPSASQDGTRDAHHELRPATSENVPSPT